MLSKNKIKFIQSLNRKKVRDQEQLFLVEGNKMVQEAIESDFEIEFVCATNEFIQETLFKNEYDFELVECSGDEIKKASLLQNPQQALAVVKMPKQTVQIDDIQNQFTLALDFIQDPGNLGTIIRIADWFGIGYISCSEDTVDCFNPKVIQASMGAIFRINLKYTNLAESISKANKLKIPVFGTFLEGENIYQTKLPSNGILVMGNEGNGISAEVEKEITYKIHIPSFANSNKGSESLNVATATAICCSEFRRRK